MVTFSIIQAARQRAYAALNAAPHAGTISKPETTQAQPREAAGKEGKPRGSTRTRQSLAIVCVFCQLSYLNFTLSSSSNAEDSAEVERGS